jgi:putative inorganic carbon (HCO3(-)) transporter
MINSLITLILISLLVFTPIAFGSMELWAFSIMELAILLIIILWAIESAFFPLRSPGMAGENEASLVYHSELRTPNSKFVILLLSLFLLLILFQLLPLPPGLLKIISPKTYTLRSALSVDPSVLSFPLSFVPFVTQINFFKWLTLIGLFFFLFYWGNSDKDVVRLIPIIMVMGVTESLYGMFEFFSGHGQILNLEAEGIVGAVTGTFINRNYFAGYLLMVIPLGIGYLFSREAARRNMFMGWRHRLASLDGKTLLIGFGVIVMMVGLIFSASRMGISSLLLSITLLSFLFRDPRREKKLSKTSVLIFALALLWALWIGLDAVISRFFTSAEDFKFRWTIWANTFQILRDFPLFGSGLGTFIYIFPMVRSFHLIGIATHAENDFLQLASEVGLSGIGLLLILFLFLSYKAVFGIRLLTHRDPGRYIAMGALAGILALMFHSLVERNIQVPSNAFLYTILWAIVLRITEKGTISKSAYQNISPPVGRI